MAVYAHGPSDVESIVFSAEEDIAAYRSMLLIRRFEEKAGQLYALGVIHGACPLCIGQEASIVGTLMEALPTDPVITGYRTHAALLARSDDPHSMMAELTGRRTGLNGGAGGAARMVAPEHRFYGGHGRDGLGAPIGAGLAFASSYRGDGAVTLSFFGQRAAARGRVLETYRLAAQQALPIVFVVDNNTAQPGTSVVLGSVPSAISESGRPFAIPGEQVDGTDVRCVRAAARRAILRARQGGGPTLLEMLTYRYRGHGELASLTDEGEESDGRRRPEEADPVLKARAHILAAGHLGERELKKLEKEVRERVLAAASAARLAPSPEAEDLLAMMEG